jgi:hypothetical protein
MVPSGLLDDLALALLSVDAAGGDRNLFIGGGGGWHVLRIGQHGEIGIVRGEYELSIQQQVIFVLTEQEQHHGWNAPAVPTADAVAAATPTAPAVPVERNWRRDSTDDGAQAPHEQELPKPPLSWSVMRSTR